MIGRCSNWGKSCKCASYRADGPVRARRGLRRCVSVDREQTHAGGIGPLFLEPDPVVWRLVAAVTSLNLGLLLLYPYAAFGQLQSEKRDTRKMRAGLGVSQLLLGFSQAGENGRMRWAFVLTALGVGLYAMGVFVYERRIVSQSR